MSKPAYQLDAAQYTTLCEKIEDIVKTVENLADAQSNQATATLRAKVQNLQATFVDAFGQASPNLMQSTEAASDGNVKSEVEEELRESFPASDPPANY